MKSRGEGQLAMGGTTAQSDDAEALVARLTARGLDAARVVAQVKRKPELVEALIASAGSETARVKFSAIKVLRTLSEQAPELIYPHFDFFVGLLQHENSILRWNAILALGSLAVVDRETKVEGVIDAYLAPISGPNLIDATSTIRGAATIALAKPHLADTIAKRILGVDRASYATPECQNVAIGHAIRALGQFLVSINDKVAVRQFARRQVNNPRPATRRKAQALLKKWPADL
jgi:HEAT repeat protein